MKILQNMRVELRFAFIAIICLLLITSTGDAGARLNTTVTNEGGSFPHTTIFTNVSGHPSSNVPDNPGVHFSNTTRPFIQIYGSPNGNWITAARTDYSGGSMTILVNGEAKLFEEDPAPWTGGSYLITNLQSKASINDDGWWIFPAATEEPNGVFIITASPSDVYSVAVQYGDPVSQIPGTTWGFSLFSSVIANSGAVGWLGNLLGPPPAQNQAFVFDGELLGQLGVTVPEGQVNNNSWNLFFNQEFFVSADGDHWSMRGNLKGDADVNEVFVVDNTVVVQEGTILPNSTYSEEIDTFFGSFMDHAGNWYVRGTNETTGQDWIYRNGEVIAERDAPIHAGATELFTDTNSSVTFNLHVGDSFGNYIVAGATDNLDPYGNIVLVANNETVVLRRGDPVDMDNNGQFDDNAYFDIVGDDDAFLSDNGNLYFLAWIMNGANTRIGQGIFKMDLSSILNYPEPTNFVYMPFAVRPE